jgi:hypothetical protein
MLCIFNGPLTRIEIRQPPEGMHFGAGGFEKTSLRKVTKENAGKQINLIKDYGPGAGARPSRVEPKHHELKVPFRKPEALGVVDVTELKKLLHQALKDSDGTDKFTSAEFAVQMTESPGQLTITVGKTQ